MNSANEWSPKLTEIKKSVFRHYPLEGFFSNIIKRVLTLALHFRVLVESLSVLGGICNCYNLGETNKLVAYKAMTVCQTEPLSQRFL